MSLVAASNCSKMGRKIQVHIIYLVKENEGICDYDDTCNGLDTLLNRAFDGFGSAKATLIVDGNLASKLKLFQLDLQKVNKRYMRRCIVQMECGYPDFVNISLILIIYVFAFVVHVRIAKGLRIFFNNCSTEFPLIHFFCKKR